MNHVVLRNVEQQVEAINQRRHDSADVLDSLQQSQWARKTRIVGHKRDSKHRFATQVLQQVIRLHCLTA